MQLHSPRKYGLSTHRCVQSCDRTSSSLHVTSPCDVPNYSLPLLITPSSLLFDGERAHPSTAPSFFTHVQVLATHARRPQITLAKAPVQALARWVFAHRKVPDSKSKPRNVHGLAPHSSSPSDWFRLSPCSLSTKSSLGGLRRRQRVRRTSFGMQAPGKHWSSSHRRLPPPPTCSIASPRPLSHTHPPFTHLVTCLICSLLLSL